MKTVKTILALALAMIAFLPACKKVDYTKNSSNILIARYKTVEEYIGMDANTVASNLKSAGWESIGKYYFSKIDNDKFLTVNIDECDSKDIIVEISFGVAPADPESGKEVFSDTDYSDFLKMLGKTPTVGPNNVQCIFAGASYLENEESGEENIYRSYDDYNKNISKLATAYHSMVAWEGTVESLIQVERRRTGTTSGFGCTMGVGE